MINAPLIKSKMRNELAIIKDGSNLKYKSMNNQLAYENSKLNEIDDILTRKRAKKNLNSNDINLENTILANSRNRTNVWNEPHNIDYGSEESKNLINALSSDDVNVKNSKCSSRLK